jgi:protein gp37
MAARLKKMGSANYQNDGNPRTSGPGFGVTCHPHMLDQPLRWKRPRRIFVNSMSDLFHPDVPYEFIVSIFAVMALASQHTFQILTKRPQRMKAILGSTNPGFKPDVDTAAFELDRELSRRYEWCSGYTGVSTSQAYWLPNVWLGTSIELDRFAFRADRLRFTPAAVRFISAEPLLGPLPSLDLTGIDWLIVGGESGTGARPMHPNWARDLRDKCMCPVHPDDCSCGRRTTAFHFKQWGSWAPINGEGNSIRYATTHGIEFGRWVDPVDGATRAVRLTHHDVLMSRFGKHAAGRQLDGRTWDEFPRKEEG